MTDFLFSYKGLPLDQLIFFIIFPSILIGLVLSICAYSISELKRSLIITLIGYPLLTIMSTLISLPLGIMVLVGGIVLIFVRFISAIFHKNLTKNLQKPKQYKVTSLIKMYLKIAIAPANILIIYFFQSFFIFIVLNAAFVVVMAYLSYLESRHSMHNYFLKLQSILPTSTVRSIAMGQVELKGRAVAIKPVLTAIDEKPCVGYCHMVRIYNNQRGHHDTSGEVIYKKTVCNDFYLEDDTGCVLVKGQGLEFFSFTEDFKAVLGDDNLHIQYVLNADEEVLLIGNAVSEEGKTVITIDPLQQVTMITPFESITRWNTFQPLRSALVSTYIFIALSYAVLLMLDIRQDGQKLSINFAKPSFSNMTNKNNIK